MREGERERKEDTERKKLRKVEIRIERDSSEPGRRERWTLKAPAHTGPLLPRRIPGVGVGAVTHPFSTAP